MDSNAHEVELLAKYCLVSRYWPNCGRLFVLFSRISPIQRFECLAISCVVSIPEANRQDSVYIAFPLLLVVTAAAPFFLFGNLVVRGLLGVIVAFCLAAAAVTSTKSDLNHLKQNIGSPVIICMIPAFWMGLQTMPLQSIGLYHPIWVSAATALGYPLQSTMTIDIGATLVALSCYVLMITLALLAAVIALDRNRAEKILFALLVASSLASLSLIVHDLSGLTFLDVSAPHTAESRSSVENLAALGVIISTAAIIRAFERSETRRLSHRSNSNALMWTLISAVLGVAALIVAFTALMLSASVSLIIATTCGWIMMLGIALIRRTDFSKWTSVALVTMLAFGVFVLASRSGSGNADLTLRFAGHAPASLLLLTDRILVDIGALGTGAGTFDALVPIYRDVGDDVTTALPATSAAAIAIELGRVALWISVILAVAWAGMLIRASLQRGRDSFYALMGAGCLVALTLGAFTNNGLFALPTTIIVAAVLGLAQAQSVSRTQA